MSEIKYSSTRGKGGTIRAASAIINGIAEDGGLYVPEQIPKIPLKLEEMKNLSYQELAKIILQLYLDDFSSAEIEQAVMQAYDSKFDTPAIAPVITAGNEHFLELFHGPTLAFKDMALTILPYLLKTAAQKTGQNMNIVILTATSGDTGKAALEGFAGVEGTTVFVFFPEHGVSQVQKRQMVTQAGSNTHVVGIEGNFDDAQNGVKAMFGDSMLREKLSRQGYLFSSANSINIGRLVPQIVYYFSAYLQLMQRGAIRAGEPVHFCVPTGNFGNILAGYYAKQMGLPVGKLLCASNSNKVLFDFMQTGEYDRNREFYITISPSMDILISSNLERLLYHAAHHAADDVCIWMEKLSTEGKYTVSQTVREQMREFAGGYASENETRAAIAGLYHESGYLMDTHTAVAYAVLKKFRSQTGDQQPAVIVSTASPYKFPRDVLSALDPKYHREDEFALFSELAALTGTDIPAPVAALQLRPILHKRVCAKEDMQKTVEEILVL